MAFARIVCGTDFSADAAHALRRAAALAAEHGANLEVLHVVSAPSLEALRQWVREPMDLPERLVEASRDELQQMTAQAARETGARIAPRVALGDVSDGLLAAASSADLVVLGAHGMNPLKDAMLGTTAERIAGRSTRPLLVVRTAPRQGYRNILVALDLLPGSDAALRSALEIAAAGTLTALHAFDVPFEGLLKRAGVSEASIDEHRARAYGESVERIAELSRALTGDADRFLPFSERGDAAATIVRRQRSMRADLVIMLKRARSLGESLLLGSVTRHVLGDVACDVLLVPEATPGPAA